MSANDTTVRKAKRDLAWGIVFMALIAGAVYDYWNDGRLGLWNFLFLGVFSLSYACQQIGDAVLTLRYARLSRQAKIRQNVLRKLNP